MNEQDRSRIKTHLERKDVQERILQYIKHGRSEATVTIGRAARLFDFSESNLRYWESLDLLRPVRSKDTVTGQRQYSFSELDKLAIIKALLEEGYAANDIPPNIDDIWTSIRLEDGRSSQEPGTSESSTEYQYIDQRLDAAYGELFVRYYIFHILRLSLLLICEDVPDTRAGLVLPLQETRTLMSVSNSAELGQVGEALVGWLTGHSFTVFLTSKPAFEYPSDYRVLPLQAMEEDMPLEGTTRDGTWIILERRAEPLTLSKPVVETIQLFLALLYEHANGWRPYFGRGVRDMVYPQSEVSTTITDNILQGLAKRVVQLGGRTAEGKNRWRFCCILLPDNPQLPLQKRSLVIQAKTKNAPSSYRTGITTFPPVEPSNSLPLRAFWSGHIVYRPEIFQDDFMAALSELEVSSRSAIAVPVEGEDGQSIAVIYVVSNEAHAFSESDQRALRMIGKVISELLMTYHVQQNITRRLSNVIMQPEVVDTSFRDFLSENDFVGHVESLLLDIQMHMKGMQAAEPEPALTEPAALNGARQGSVGVISFIAIDIDDQSSLANKYGDRLTRNLSRAVGQRIQGQMSLLLRKNEDSLLYHIYADRFYLLLREFPFERARDEAEKLREVLEGTYHVDAVRISTDQPTLSHELMDLPGVTVRLGVISYTRDRLEEVLRRFPGASATGAVRSAIMRSLDEALELGKTEGGNSVVAWNSDDKKFERWPPKHEE